MSEKYINFMNSIFDLLLLGIMWIAFSLPVITIGTSTAALYYSVVKCVKHGESYPMRCFLHSFRENLKKGVLMMAGAGVAVGLIVTNIRILLNHGKGSNTELFLIMLYGMILFWILTAAVYLMIILSKYDMSCKWILKQAFDMMFRHLGTTIMIWCVLMCATALLYRFPILFFLAPGPVMLLISEFMEGVLK